MCSRSSILVNLSTFREHRFSTAVISHTSCHNAMKFSTVRGVVNGHLFPEFG